MTPGLLLGWVVVLPPPRDVEGKLKFLVFVPGNFVHPHPKGSDFDLVDGALLLLAVFLLGRAAHVEAPTGDRNHAESNLGSRDGFLVGLHGLGLFRHRRGILRLGGKPRRWIELSYLLGGKRRAGSQEEKS